ncbi:unnamed protein product [Moneuplotes crassus]|uniref:Glutathione peroxidase n=1 Tax=Euplotes crassus TaxID=5936 RepID=A0AAD1XTF6_EUPCR|nr:unnamed protein product [Moneuplotes crassus]
MGAMLFHRKKESLEPVYTSIFDIPATDIEGNEVILGDLVKDCKCVMIVNVASKCMLANKHYTQMVKIHKCFQHKGFQILAFPCNQFLGQESCSNDDINEFVRTKYGVEFKMMAKVNVNGVNSHEVFKFCRKYSSLYDEKTGKLKSIPFNFSKFLINSKGQVEGFYSPKKKPDSMIDKIKEILQRED